MSTFHIFVVDKQHVDAEVEECEGDGATCATSADEKSRLAVDEVPSKRFFERASEPDAIRVVTDSPVVAIESDRIHRSNLARFRRHLVEQKQHGLFAWISDVDTLEANSTHGVHEIA